MVLAQFPGSRLLGHNVLSKSVRVGAMMNFAEYVTNLRCLKEFNVAAIATDKWANA